MTEDYKSKLLKYLTGNIEVETELDEPQFINAGYTSSNIKTYINSYFINGGGIYGSVTTNDTDYHLYYGYYYYDTDQTDMRGFILIANATNEPVQMITQFDSGTDFRPFSYLEIDEDGNIYGIDEEYQPDSSPLFTNYRFIMLNKILYSNVSSETFVVSLRKSYFIPSTYLSTIYNVWGCTKQINTSNYFIFIETSDAKWGILSLKINVGESNEWKSTTTNLLGSFGLDLVYFNDYTSENFKIIISGLVSGSPTYNNYREVVYEFSDTPTITLLTTINAPITTQYYTVPSMTRTSYQDTYVIYEEILTTTDVFHFCKVNYTTNTFDELETFTTPISYDFAIFQKKGSLPFFRLYWRTEENGNYVMKNYLGIIVNDEVYSIALDDVLYTEFSKDFFIKENYNLYEIYTDANNSKSQKTQLIYNPTNYNGLPYEDINCISPDSSILYDTNNNIIFARNLYNKTVLGATTTSTVQIPNTLLNNVIIGKNDLVSATNVTLTEDGTDIEKNIYETVNINFANSISMRNDNDPNNVILNPMGAVRINQSTSQTLDYANAQGTKVKVNYMDGTSEVITLNASSQITFIDDTTANYVFNIYVEKAISNLQIISFDENTVYQTITGLTLTVGKTYTIEQQVEVQ